MHHSDAALHDLPSQHALSGGWRVRAGDHGSGIGAGPGRDHVPAAQGARGAGRRKGWRRQLHVLIDDLEIIGHSRSLRTSFVQSLPYLMIQIIPIYGAMRGFGFDLSLQVAFVLMVVLRLSTVVPQAPGNLGLFQVVVVETMEKVFNVAHGDARFSLVLWGIMTLPLLIGGAISLAVTEGKLSELQEAAKAETSQITSSRL